tara:strand:+ start:3056 stop:3634 length:579 start_codon:yes stop_codon:yes gene_type:complete
MLNRENTIKSLKDKKIQIRSGIKIQELPFTKKINLQINSNDKDRFASCATILGTLLPTKPNSFSKKENVKVIWLSPKEWLIVYSYENDFFYELKNKIGDVEGSVTDVSENRTIIRLSGEKIFFLLSKFLVLDLEKNLSTESSCAQTLFVKIPILLVKNSLNNQIPEIDIFTNRSHANYLFNLLLDGTNNLDI